MKLAFYAAQRGTSKRIPTLGQVKPDNTACQAPQRPNLAFAELMRGERKHWRGGRGVSQYVPAMPLINGSARHVVKGMISGALAKGRMMTDV